MVEDNNSRIIFEENWKNEGSTNLENKVIYDSDISSRRRKYKRHQG